jgi:hypothetical protein
MLGDNGRRRHSLLLELSSLELPHFDLYPPLAILQRPTQKIMQFSSSSTSSSSYYTPMIIGLKDSSDEDSDRQQEYEC